MNMPSVACRTSVLAVVIAAFAVGTLVPASAAGAESGGVSSEESEAVAQQEPTPAAGIAIGDSRLELYGFVRIDAIYDDSRADAAQTPTFIRSEDPRVGVADQSNYTYHPRLTRVGGNITAPPSLSVAGASLSARVEIDFQAGGRESRQLIRLRHGYFGVSWSRVSLLAGQTSDIISPLFPAVNGDTLMWNAGNLGDRRPQFRVTWTPAAGSSNRQPRLAVVVGLGLSGAIHSKDLDSDGVRDGEASGVPNLQTRVGLSVPTGGEGRDVNVSVSAHVGKEELTVPIQGEDSFTSWSMSLDYEVDIVDPVRVRGEWWTGENLSDFRGGIGQGINTVLGGEIRSTGGWVEGALQLSQAYSLHLGYTVDDPEDADIVSRGRTKNFAWYVVNQFQLARKLLVGIDYLRWTTEYQDLLDGTDNRVNVYNIFRF